ncbi:MAG: hypothetical protein ABI113_11995, partial [Mucilaginibacter sp.]
AFHFLFMSTCIYHFMTHKGCSLMSKKHLVYVRTERFARLLKNGTPDNEDVSQRFRCFTQKNETLCGRSALIGRHVSGIVQKTNITGCWWQRQQCRRGYHV